MCAAAITNQKLTIKDIVQAHLETITSKLEEMNFEIDVKENELTIFPTKILPVNIITTNFRISN